MDKPSAILKSSIRNSDKRELLFLIDWKMRIDGVKPTSSWISANDLRNNAPEVLCDFLLKHVKIPDNISPSA